MNNITPHLCLNSKFWVSANYFICYENIDTGILTNKGFLLNGEEGWWKLKTGILLHCRISIWLYIELLTNLAQELAILHFNKKDIRMATYEMLFLIVQTSAELPQLTFHLAWITLLFEFSEVLLFRKEAMNILKFRKKLKASEEKG